MFMQVHQTQTEGQIASIIERELEAMGYELVRVKLMGGVRRKTLQLMVDRIDGIPTMLQDCERVSRHVSVLLDVNDPIETQYVLEVSSPGINRPLTRYKDLVSHVGSRIKLSLKVPLEGQKNFIGTLISVMSDQINLRIDNSEKEQAIDIENMLEVQLIALDPQFGKKRTLNNKKSRRK